MKKTRRRQRKAVIAMKIQAVTAMNLHVSSLLSKTTTNRLLSKASFVARGKKGGRGKKNSTFSSKLQYLAGEWYFQLLTGGINHAASSIQICQSFSSLFFMQQGVS